MTNLDEARSLDAHDRPLEALTAYRRAVANCEAELHAYLDLAVLLFECYDDGYAHQHNIPELLRNTAIGRAYEVLDQADARFGQHPETNFWQKYIIHIITDSDDFFSEAEGMIGTETIVPAFYLIAGPRASFYVSQARTLHDIVMPGSTARERYIKAVLESSVFDRILRGDHE